MKLRPRSKKFSLFYFTSQSWNTSLDFLCVKLYLRCTFFLFRHVDMERSGKFPKFFRTRVKQFSAELKHI